VSLRTKLLALFGALAVAPLLALGLFDYFRSAHAVEALLDAQTGAVSRRVAMQAINRLSSIHSDLALLAGNAETVRLLETGAGHDDAVEYLQTALGVVGAPYTAISLRDSLNREVLALSGGDTLSHGPYDSARGELAMYTLAEDAPGMNGKAVGRLLASIQIPALIPREYLNDRVGTRGYTVVFDVTARRPVFDPGVRGESERGIGAFTQPTVQVSATDTVGWSATYVEHDSARVATVVPIGDGLAVLSSAAVAEYAGPLTRGRSMDLLLALFVTLAIAIAFLLVSRRVTAPLESLTLAAAAVGRGDFAPRLPPVREDEVGKLADAFRRMSEQLGETMRELESSRQMAAVGQFAAQIAHEIRNPLTSIKLNLQSLEREIRDGTFGEESSRPLEICIQEIQRLDRVVRGVLQLGRTRTQLAARERVAIHQLLSSAVDLARGEFAARSITIDLRCDAGFDVVHADEDELRGVLLNLLRNAAEALPDGGRIRVATSAIDGPAGLALHVRVADDGPGIPARDRANVFDPFYSTKKHGNGLGLALATRDIERHRGRLSLLDEPGELGGATFTIDLPLAEHA
jgi:signal transduction histidine kinase